MRRQYLCGVDLYKNEGYDTACRLAPQDDYQESEASVNILLRRPYRYLAVHWTVTLGLAAALLAPQFTTRQDHASTPSVSTVTLPTGQVVQLDGQGNPRLQAGIREGRLYGDDQYAVPSSVPASSIGEYTPPATGTSPCGAGADAVYTNVVHQGSSFAYDYVCEPAQPVAPANVFDPKIFDLTALVADGYDDPSSATIPVIVRFATPELARAAVSRGLVDGIHFTSAFEYLPDAAGTISKRGPFLSSDPAVAAQAGIVNVALDSKASLPAADSSANLEPQMDQARDLINTDAARAAGLTGKGITIGIVDTGIDASHGDLKDRVIAAKDFTNDKDPNDGNGHGTHVAGIAAGTGALSDGKYGGIAPQAQLINAKALSKFGSGSISGIMKAMEWAADQGARIENMSLGGGPSNGKDTLSQEVNAITAKKKVLFVIAAGNSGPRGKVSTPAAADDSLAVGAIDKERQLASFSSRGPRTGDFALKPDIVTPGVRITAPKANYGSGDPYWTLSGTSMASPVTAGAAALVLQLHPTWSPAQVKYALMSSAQPIGAECEVSAYDQGTGLVNLANIVKQQVVVEPAGLSLGQLKGGNGEATLKITNISKADLQLDPGGQLCGPGGEVAGALTFDQTSVKVPAGGSTSLKLQVKGITTPGEYSGTLLFQSGGEQVAQGAVAFVVK